MAGDWQSISAKKREQRDVLIPKEWRLPGETLGLYHKDTPLNVLDVPRTCGILSAKELELTEKYDATALLAMLASGEIR
jgi:amidase